MNAVSMAAPKASSSIVQIRPALLAKVDACAYLSLSETSFDREVTAGAIPRPVKLGKGRVAWKLVDLDAYVDGLQESDLLPPKNSGYGRAGKPD